MVGSIPWGSSVGNILVIAFGDGKCWDKLEFERKRGEEGKEGCGDCLGDGKPTVPCFGDGFGDAICGGRPAVPIFGEGTLGNPTEPTFGEGTLGKPEIAALGEGAFGNPAVPSCGDVSAEVLALGDAEAGGGGFFSEFIIL